LQFLEGAGTTPTFAAVQAHPSLDCRMLLKIRFPEQKTAAQEGNKELRKLSQWAFDTKTNTLIQTPGVTSKNAKSLIVLDDGN
jgi:hypothetical protein